VPPAGKAGPVTGQLIEVSDLAKRQEATVSTMLKVSDLAKRQEATVSTMLEVSDLAKRYEATVSTVLDGSAAHPRRRRAVTSSGWIAQAVRADDLYP
jgi:hypothetical protein